MKRKVASIDFQFGKGKKIKISLPRKNVARRRVDIFYGNIEFVPDDWQR